VSKALAFRIIARGCLQFIKEHGSVALPVLESALTIFADVVEMRVTEEERERTDRADYFTALASIEERLAKLENGRPS
jgi:hypothetical protein